MSNGIESRVATKTGITFTVNTAVNEVQLFLAGNPAFEENAGLQYFAAGDNIIIRGFCLSLPYQFGQGSMDIPMFFQLGWFDSGIGSGNVEEVGGTGYVNIPDPNVWYDMEVFVPYKSTASLKWGLQVNGLGGYVSMINAPAALNTVELEAQIHLRVQRTSPMLA